MIAPEEGVLSTRIDPEERVAAGQPAHRSEAPEHGPMRREAFSSGSASDLRSLVPLLLVTWLIDDLALDNRMVRPVGTSSIQRGRHL